MTLFFDLAYAAVLFLAFVVAGSIPATVLGSVAPSRNRRLALPGLGLALAGWIWFGWIGGLYGISRAGLVLYSGVAALGFVRGWVLGLDFARRARGGGTGRARRPRTPASPR